MKNKPIPLFAFTLLCAFCLVFVFLASWAGGDPGFAQALPLGAKTPYYLPFLVWHPTPTLLPTPRSGADLAVSRVEVIQGITMNSPYRVHVANRPTTLRVFVSLSGAASVANVQIRLTRYMGNSPQPNTLLAGPITVLPATNEGSLAQTFNFILPADWLAVGTSYVLELDPPNRIAESNEANNRYPASGAQSFNFIAAEPLDIVLVPIDYQPPGGRRTLPDTSRTAYLAWLPFKVYPVGSISYTWHSPLVWKQKVADNGAGWSDLLTYVQNIHNSEDPGRKKVYYGVINTFAAHGCPSGCVVGLGYLGWPTAIGFAGWTRSSPGGEETAGETLTHEVGHNFNRPHVRCSGQEASPDPGYPYRGGGIGTWGLDVSAGTLYDPGVYKDYMSYCSRTWTSDYTYKAIFDFRQSAPFGPVELGLLTDTLSLVGWIAENGEIHALPLYRQAGLVGGLDEGTHRLELLGVDGKALAEVPFTPVEISDGPAPSWGFSLSFPYTDGIGGLRIYNGQGKQIYERLLPGVGEGAAHALPALALAGVEAGRGEDGKVNVSWAETDAPGVTYRVRFSADGGQNWQVLVLGQVETVFTLPAGLLAEAASPLLEIQVVDGLRIATEVVDLR